MRHRYKPGSKVYFMPGFQIVHSHIGIIESVSDQVSDNYWIKVIDGGFMNGFTLWAKHSRVKLL